MSPDRSSVHLLSLPPELIIEIFSYVSDRRSLPFVCQKFYQIICLIEKLNYCRLSINDEKTVSMSAGCVSFFPNNLVLQLLNNTIFASIISSHRQISGIKLQIGLNYSDLFWSRFEAIVLKLRHTIETLELSFMDVPQMFPNDLKLVNILHLLPFDCPRTLKISNMDLAYLKRFLSSRKINQMTIIGAVKDVTIFQKLNLDELTLIAPKCNINEALMHQKKLKSFKLVADESTVIDNETLAIIAGLEDLTEIDIPLMHLDSYDCIRTFQKMSNLRNLNFQSTANFAFEFCNSLTYQTITELDISVPSELLAENIFDNINVKFPNLKSLGIRTPMALKIFKNICIGSLITLDSLLIENIFYGFVGITILDLHEYNIIQRKVRRLILMNHDRKVIICKNDLLRLLKLFPNLECLVLSGYFDTQNYLEYLLKSMKSLKEILIKSSNHSTTHIMGIIKGYGTHLRLIVLENFRSGCDVENLKMFFEDQFPIIEKKNSNLVLRKAGHLVLKEFS